jgi:hypothetical protein
MELTVTDLVRRFDSGEIRLPLMQRDYVWKPKKVVKLLDSLYKGWPIGSFYVWQTRDSHPDKKRIGKSPPRHLDGFYGFLLDGQQRLTSLSLAIQGEADVELARRGFFDIENEQFYLGEMKKTLRKRIEASDPLIAPLSDYVSLEEEEDQRETLKTIERTLDAMREQRKLGPAHGRETAYCERLHRLARMLRRRALCEEFKDDHEEHAFELFSRLNKGGTSLSAGDVEAARLASAATKKIVEPMRAFVAEKEMRRLGINFVFLLRTLVTVHRGNCSFSKLPRNWAEDTHEIDAAWGKTEKALRETVRFVCSEVGWTSRRWLPSTMALIPVTYLLAKTGGGEIRGKDAEIIKRYLLISGLRSFFRGGTETAVNVYVNAVRDASGDRSKLCRALIARIPKSRLYAIRSDEVRGTSKLYAPVMQVYLAYLLTGDAKSWPSGRALRDVVREEVTGDPLAVHHVFPKKFMQDLDFPVDRLNTMANYALLSQADNAELSERDPYNVWQSMKENQQEWASAQLGFQASSSLLKRGAYDEFAEFRAKKLAEQLNVFLGLG